MIDWALPVKSVDVISKVARRMLVIVLEIFCDWKLCDIISLYRKFIVFCRIFRFRRKLEVKMAQISFFLENLVHETVTIEFRKWSQVHLRPNLILFSQLIMILRRSKALSLVWTWPWTLIWELLSWQEGVLSWINCPSENLPLVRSIKCSLEQDR